MPGLKKQKRAGEVCGANSLVGDRSPCNPLLVTPEPFIKKPVVSHLTGKTTRTIDAWMASGRIPFYKIGRNVFVQVE